MAPWMKRLVVQLATGRQDELLTRAEHHGTSSEAMGPTRHGRYETSCGPMVPPACWLLSFSFIICLALNPVLACGLLRHGWCSRLCCRLQRHAPPTRCLLCWLRLSLRCTCLGSTSGGRYPYSTRGRHSRPSLGRQSFLRYLAYPADGHPEVSSAPRLLNRARDFEDELS